LTVLGKRPDPSVILLTGNFVDYSRLAPPHWGGHEFYLWFLACMAQMLAMLWLAAVVWRALGIRLGPVRFAVALFALGCLTRFVAPIFLTPDFLTATVSPLSRLAHLPTTHLATMMLGSLIAIAERPRHRAIMLACLAGYVALTARFYSLHSAAILLAAATLMILAPRLPLPRPLTALALVLSGASLFIYLTHMPAYTLLQALNAPDWPLLQVAIALVGGVGVWMAWVRASSALARIARRPAAALSQPAV
jgi:hypothetical protein